MSNTESDEDLVELRIKVPRTIKEMFEHITDLDFGDDEFYATHNLAERRTHYFTKMAESYYLARNGPGSLERFYKVREPGFRYDNHDPESPELDGESGPSI